ncbi:MAG: Trk system potassium transporter TrkA [candidate division NC10 bacterium]|nr:Trk system potassium transporter TrkA [candidate division NC10 bacterium]MCZ6550824.1 Trk system potassium transporter TrkA [candidate division NC10 bacterium]
MRAIVVGAGEVGYHIAKRLDQEGHDVTIIEENAAVKERVEKELDVMTILGNGASPAALEAAGVRKTDLLIAVTDEDEVNLVISLLAKEYGVATTIARARNPEFSKSSFLQSGGRLGIDTLINPNQAVAEEIARLVHTPAAAQVAFFAEGKVELLGIDVRPEAPALRQRLKDLRSFQAQHPFIVTAISRNDELQIPYGETVIEPGDRLYVVAHRDDIPDILNRLGRQEEPPREVLIIGGGRIGLFLAEILEAEAEGIRITLMERDRKRCEELAEHLKRAKVIVGDGTDVQALAEEGIVEMDAVVTVSGDEATNILAALLLKKRLKAKKAIALVQRSHFIKLASSLGIDAISPRLTTASAILRSVRRGRVVSVVEMPEGDAEIMELVALPTTPVVDRPLREVNMPKGAIVAAISRGEQIIIPKGDTCILPDDRVILFTLPEAIPKVEELFSG